MPSCNIPHAFVHVPFVYMPMKNGRLISRGYEPTFHNFPTYIYIHIIIYIHIPLKFHEYSPKNTWSLPSQRQHGARQPRSVRIHSLLLRSHGPAGKLAIASAICNIYVAIAVFGVLPLKPLFQQHPRHLLHKFNWQILKVYIYIKLLLRIIM